MQRLMPLCHSRIKTFGDFMALCDFFFINHLNYTPELFAIKGVTNTQLCQILQAIIWHLEETTTGAGRRSMRLPGSAAAFLDLNHKKR